MRLFDTHCHLTDTGYRDELNDVMVRAGEAGVRALMLVGITLDDSERTVRLARTLNSPGTGTPRLPAGESARPVCFASVGIHPHDAKTCSDAALKRLRELAADPVVMAWGETGLDFNRMFSPQAVQETWFERQLAAAGELDLPVILHERDSGGRFLEMLQAAKPRAGVVHCFSGNGRELAGYLDLGLMIGITGILTVSSRGKELRELVRYIPLDRLLVETDAPYLTPTPERNKHRRNEPAFVRSTLLKLAEVLDQPTKTVADAMWNNAVRLFRLS